LTTPTGSGSRWRPAAPAWATALGASERRRPTPPSTWPDQCFWRFKGGPEQPTLVSIPLFLSWHKIKYHSCLSRCSFYGTSVFGKVWRQNF
jgi:hypothetical protein